MNVWLAWYQCVTIRWS